jgi:hypothetical protein
MSVNPEFFTNNGKVSSDKVLESLIATAKIVNSSDMTWKNIKGYDAHFSSISDKFLNKEDRELFKTFCEAMMVQDNDKFFDLSKNFWTKLEQLEKKYMDETIEKKINQQMSRCMILAPDNVSIIRDGSCERDDVKKYLAKFDLISFLRTQLTIEYNRRKTKTN